MIAAIITAYKPDPGFKARFLPLLAECGAVIVVDNTPGGHQSFDLPPGFIVVHNLQNLGLAPALNVGLREARRQEASVVILFDQDSTPSATFAREMAQSLDRAVAIRGERCCVGPTHVDDGMLATGAAADAIHPALTTESVMSTVACLPTSGMVFRLAALKPDDGFSDEFFLDLVDFEWCWRLRSRGWTFLRDNHVRMFHRLGVAERSFLGLTFHVPAPYRHYFQMRDTLRLAFKDYVPRYSKLRLIGILPIKILVYPLILDRGLERLTWMARGMRDYLRKVRGMGAASACLSR